MHWLTSHELVSETTNTRIGIATSPSDPGVISLYVSVSEGQQQQYHTISLTRYEAEALADVILNAAQRCGHPRVPSYPQEPKKDNSPTGEKGEGK